MSRFSLFLSYNLDVTRNLNVDMKFSQEWWWWCDDDDDDDDAMMTSWWRRMLNMAMMMIIKSLTCGSEKTRTWLHHEIFLLAFCNWVIVKSFHRAHSARTLGKCTFDCVISIGKSLYWCFSYNYIYSWTNWRRSLSCNTSISLDWFKLQTNEW